MIVALGIDVCSIDRVRRAIERHGEAFAARLLSPRELADRGGADEATFVAGRFAARAATASAGSCARTQSAPLSTIIWASSRVCAGSCLRGSATRIG